MLGLGAEGEDAQSSSGGEGGTQAVAIAVPIVVVLLAAGAGAVLYRRRRRFAWSNVKKDGVQGLQDDMKRKGKKGAKEWATDQGMQKGSSKNMLVLEEGQGPQI